MKFPVPILSIPLIFSLCLGAIVVPVYDVDAMPLATTSSNTNVNVSVHHAQPQNVITPTTSLHPNGVIDCKICEYVTSHLNATLFDNPKVLSFVTTDIQKLCTVLPESLQNECNAEAVNIAPFVLEQIGAFIASEGCHDLGVCP